MIIWPDWLETHLRIHRADEVCRIDGVANVGVSGGKTSGLLGLLLKRYNNGNGQIYYNFRNTGLEHTNTYVFLSRLGECLPLTWLEFRPPQSGEPPASATTAVVSFESAHRGGKLFEAFLEMLASYRAKVKELWPIVPYAHMRLCTAYLKIKTADRYMQSNLGYDAYQTHIGIRIDEVHRYIGAKKGETKKRTIHAPLVDLYLTKEMVNEFWRCQPFTLEIPENLGNCTLCFLKDESDLAHNMLYEISDSERQWWIDIQNKYGQFRAGGVTYEEIHKEAWVRFKIREILQAGKQPLWHESCGVSEYRFGLLINQERRVLREGLVRLPCMCENATAFSDEDILGNGFEDWLK